MKASQIRTAIYNGLDARAAWDAIDLFRYPAGVLAGRPNGFALGKVQSADTDEEDLGGDTHRHDYDIEGLLWVSTDGSEDADFASVEAEVEALLEDLVLWLESVGHGKQLGIAGVDYLGLGRWNIDLTYEPAAAVADFTLEVTELT